VGGTESRFFRLVFYDAETTRLSPFIEAHTGVQNLSKFFKGFAQLIPIYTVWQVADVN